MLVRSIYEMNTAAQQRKTTVCHACQPERTAVADEGGTCAAGDPAANVGSVMGTPAGLAWYNPSRLVRLRPEHGDGLTLRPESPIASPRRRHIIPNGDSPRYGTN